MKRVLSITTALLLLGSTAAMARGYEGYNHSYRSYGYHDRGGNIAGAAVAAGIVGLALGALATSQSHYYAPAYVAPPAYGYYGAPAYAAPAYRYAPPAYGYARGYGYGGPSLSLGFGF
jgi:hypothetical protein